jgi:CelD/BcsL family acetyltransferase involved in cellulose biosynthesis
MPLRIESIDSLTRLAALGPAWDEVAPAPFSTVAWISAWWRAFGRGRLATCALWDDGELVAGFPLAERSRSCTALANTETPAFRPVARSDPALAQLSEAVTRSAAVLEVPNLPEGEPAHRALLAAGRAAGRLQTTVPQYSSPLTDTTGDFASYRAPRKSQWRELERRGRKMAREHEVQTRLIEPPRALEQELDEGLTLEAAGWKGRAATSILASSRMAAFYRAVARDAHERDELRLSSLRLDGRLVAFDLALLSRRRYFLLKTAYDESARQLAPGLVLRRAVVERCFDMRLDAHEFLGIDMPWKQLFATANRRHLRYRAYSRHPVPLARYAYRGVLRPAAKRALRR